MSIFIDRTFLLRLSPKLTRFTRKKDDLYQFRCPLCGDSFKDKTKCRGFIYRKSNDYFYMCHNCGVSTTFYNFLKQVDPNLVKEYALERYKDTSPNIVEKKKETLVIKSAVPKFKKTLPIPKISSLPDDHYAKIYVKNRLIPEAYWSELYYADDYKKFVNVDMKIEKSLYDNDKRLVIPFYDKDNKLIGFQGRTLSDSKMRYITIKLDENSPKAFGLNKIDEDDLIYVVEGPIDSLFLKNSIAITSSNLEYAEELFDKTKIVLVFDNEPRNKEILKLINHAIDNHFSVCIWPEMIVEKDINDMILSGFSKDDIQDIVEKNTFVNLRAKMEFINWKKLDI